MKRKAFYYLYILLAKHLPLSYTFWGKLFHSKQIRYFVCKNIFKECGKNVNIEKGADFGSGFELSIGDNSGIGANCTVPYNIKIGNDVMMGPNCYFLSQNHNFSDLNTPMRLQGYIADTPPTIIEDDVWIGYGVIATPGRTIKKGSIIAAGCVLSKDFPECSVVGGNPSKLLKSRI